MAIDHRNTLGRIATRLQEELESDLNKPNEPLELITVNAYAATMQAWLDAKRFARITK